MQQQQTLYVTQGHLFRVSDKGETTDKGTCGCALVALPVPNGVPKYSLVCYNKKRETLAVARLPADGHNTRGLHLAVERSGYVTFQEDSGSRWSLLPAKRESIVDLLAHVALAMYVLRGKPQGVPVITDFTPASIDIPLGLQHEARVRFASYGVRRPATPAHDRTSEGSDDLMELGPQRASNFNEQGPPYAFQPVQSTVALGPNLRGFEGAVVGMTEGGYRAVVTSAQHQYATRAEDLYSADTDFGPLVFVVRLERFAELVEKRAEVPAVFADATRTVDVAPVGGSNGAAGRASSNGAALVSYQEPSRQMVPAGTTTTALTVLMDGAGVPVEHMAMIQRVGAGINTATTAARDIRDITAAVADDWQHAVRATDKPSTLTHAALQDHLHQLVLQYERSAADLEQRDELIRVLDTRNRELQKQVDASAMASQKLLDEAKSTASAGMDIRLERSRTLMKLQEQVNSITQERDDAQRHLATVKRLQAATEEELQQLRGRIDIHRVQSTGMLNELEVSQTALSEARGRRKGLEARLTSLTESVRSAQAQTRAKASEVEAARAASDRAREHHIQLMEDERNSRALDAQQLRAEIVAQLANKEKTFRAERARAAEEGFRRGLDEGKHQGRRDAAAEVAAQQNELQLDVQRSKALMESRREELRAAMESAMAARRKLVTALREVQEAHADAVRTKSRLQVRHARLTRESANAKDEILERLRGVARYLTHPATPDQLMSVLTTLHHHYDASAEQDAAAYIRRQRGATDTAGTGPEDNTEAASSTDIDFSFNRLNWDAARKAAVQRRVAYLAEEALRVFEKGLAFYYAEWLQPLQAAHDACKEAVKTLWIEEYGAFHYALCEEELAKRSALVAENDAFFAALEDGLARQRAARVELLQEATEGFADLYAEYTQGLSRLRDMLAANRHAREAVAAAEKEARQRIASAALRGLREMPALLRDAVASERLTSQRFLAEEEEAGRAVLLADELGEFTVLRFTEEQARGEARQDALRARQRQEIRDEETAAREGIAAEEVAFHRRLYEQHIAVVSAIYRQSAELKRLQEAERARFVAVQAEERRALTVAEEQHRYEDVEAEEAQQRADLAGLEVSSRPPPPLSSPQQQQQQQQQQPQPGSREARDVDEAVPPPLPSAPVPAEKPPPQVTGPAPPAPASAYAPPPSLWDAPPDLPPPTPPDTPRSATRADPTSDALSPFALAWAQSDHRKPQPRPPPPAAAPPAEKAPATVTSRRARKAKANRGFDDSEEESSSSSSSSTVERKEGNMAKEAAPAAASLPEDERQPPPLPPADPPKKKAAPKKKHRLFASSSDEDA